MAGALERPEGMAKVHISFRVLGSLFYGYHLYAYIFSDNYVGSLVIRM